MPALTKMDIPRALNDPISPQHDATRCVQHVFVSIFFDGTGNNLYADSPDMGHSNVARMFRAHPSDDADNGVYAIYVPGIGTYFKEVHDEGGTLFSKVSAKHGLARIEWAIGRLKAQLIKCDKRVDDSTHLNSKVIDIKLAVFGFSRGSAEARAFCRDLGKLYPTGRCALPKSGPVPIEVSFLGIFDTVASVGLPLSANTKLKAVTDLLVDLSSTEQEWMASRSDFDNDPLARIAFGPLAVQPAVGPNDGHYDWALDIGVGPMVRKGMHLVAAHEFRNSFPADSVLSGGAYPASMKELALAGSHSDVGGGYEPSEGGKCRARGSLVSMVSLWIMYNEAGKHVPFLQSLNFLEYNKQDFGIDAKGDAGRQAMVKSYRGYLAKLGPSDGLGKSMLSHTRLYFAWRFRAVACSPKYAAERERQARQTYQDRQRFIGNLEWAKVIEEGKGNPWREEALLRRSRADLVSYKADWEEAQREVQAASHDGDNIRVAEEGFHGQRAALMEDVRHKRDDWWQAQLRADRMGRQKTDMLVVGVKWSGDNEQALRQAKDEVPVKEDVYLRAKSRLDTKADDSELLQNINEYNAQLMDDAIKLDAWSTEFPERRLRPHYQAIVDGYRNEFQLAKGLRDPDVIDFFSNYVHDSLAAFHLDGTRPSDPRVVYVGGDFRMDYARDEVESEKLNA